MQLQNYLDHFAMVMILLGRSDTDNGKASFLTFPACFSIPIIFSNLNSNCSNLLYLRNLQEQVKKIVLTFHCSRDIKNFGLQPRISKVFLDH